MHRLLTSARNALTRATYEIARLLGRNKARPVRPRTYWDDNVALTLSNLVHETETRASGRVQLISLADFRAAVGDLWEKYKSRILIIVESTIARMIGRGNTFIPQGDDAWLMLFPNFSEEKAQEITDAIAAKIGDKLVGAQFTAHELPLPATSKLDLAVAVNADGSLNMDAVKLAVSRARQAQISTTVKNAAAEKSAGGIRTHATAPTSQSKAGQMKVLFRPAWCAETEAIDSFFFRAFTDAGANIYIEGGPAVSDATVSDLTKAAADAFTAMCTSNLRAKLAMPVPFSKLRGATRSGIQRAVASLAQRDRLLHLRLEVVQIPPAAPADELVAVRELFRPFVREVAFLTDLFTPHDQLMALDHIILGADISNEIRRDDDELFQAMLLFRQRAGRRSTYVLGLHSRSHVSHAVNAGISEVGGPGVMDDLKRLPERITPLRRDHLLAP